MSEPVLVDNLQAVAGIVFDEIAERAIVAETYSRTTADFASIGDRRGAAYALRQAAVAIASAADAVGTLYPQNREGGR